MTSRLVVAVVCLGLGAVVATLATNRLQGQATIPVPPPGAEPELISYRNAVKKVLPAVVNIEARAAAVRPPDRNLGFGSGVIIDPSGIVLTNYHVVEGAESVEVELHDGRKFISKDIHRDTKTDLAVVKLTAAKPLPFLELGDSDAAEVGDRVLAVGAPFGLTGTVTHGIISAKSRRNLNLNQYEDFIQTDAAVNPGNSGGPLVGLDGKVLGINAAIKSKSGGFQGVGLAVSSNLAKDVARQLMTTGTVRRGYLGVSVREINDELAEQAGVAKGQGVIVTKVSQGSPAGRAGLQVGDVITAIDGTTVPDVNTLPRLVARLPINQSAELNYVRDGKPAKVSVTILEQPQEYGSRKVQTSELSAPRGVRGVQHVERAGVSVTELTADMAAQGGYPRGTRGVLVVGVDRGSVAAIAGMGNGQVIVKVNQTSVTTAQEFAGAIAAVTPDRGALLHVMRPTGEVDFVLLRVK